MTGKDKIILQKISKYIMSVLSYVDGMAYEDFLQDDKTLSATAFVIGQIGELANLLAVDAQLKYPQIPWKAIRGMRNRIIHDYENVDLKMLWETISNDLPVLNEEINKIINP